MSGSWHGGKGSSPRKTDKEKYEQNYERIFGKKEREGKESGKECNDNRV